MDIYLVRHTAVAPERGICYGQTDVALAPSFEQDLAHTIAKLPAQLDAVYSSPLTRCKTLALRLHPTPVLDDRLMELNFGDWEMQWWDRITDDALPKFRADFINNAAPNGESYRDMLIRCTSFYEQILKIEHDSIAIISHGGFIRTLLCYLLCIPLEKSFDILINYGSVTKLSRSDREIKLDYVNE